MITQEQQKQGQELVKILAQKAWESSTFKEQLIENPVSIIESITGKKIQSGINVVVEDQTDTSTVYLNIPREVGIDELELTDEQLEMVSGGTDAIFWGGVAIGSIFAGAIIAGLNSTR